MALRGRPRLAIGTEVRQPLRLAFLAPAPNTIYGPVKQNLRPENIAHAAGGWHRGSDEDYITSPSSKHRSR